MVIIFFNIFVYRKVIVVFAVTALYVGFMGPRVAGTFSWFTHSPDLPSLALSDACGTRVFAPGVQVALQGTNTTANETTTTTTTEGTTVPLYEEARAERPTV